MTKEKGQVSGERIVFSKNVGSKSNIHMQKFKKSKH